MAPLQRQVLLLTVLEGFTVSDAARILGIDAEPPSAASRKRAANCSASPRCACW